MNKSAGRLMGQPIRRKEDRRFITGEGRYVDDIQLPGTAHGVLVRSPHAHARITRIATVKASELPGVLTVITGADLAAARVGSLPCGWGVTMRDGSKMVEPPHPVLASEMVRHVGDPVAFVVAETREAALDAADAVEIEYEPLPHNVDLEQAVARTRRPSGPRPATISATIGMSATPLPWPRPLRARRM